MPGEGDTGTKLPVCQASNYQIVSALSLWAYQKRLWGHEVAIRTWLLLAVAFASACEQRVPAAEGRAAEPAKGVFDPEQIVTLSKDAYGCQFQGDLFTAMEHLQNEEYSAWGAALRKENYCFNGADPKIKWTVHQAEGLLIQIGTSTLEQYEAAKDDWRFDASKQYWVPQYKAVPAN